MISPTLIVAADDEIEQRDILKQEGVHRVGDFKRATDIVNVLMAGSASAGLAMTAASALRTRRSSRAFSCRRRS